jgi:hypothetical protein
LAKEGKKPIQISESPSWQVLSRAPNTLYEGQYRRAEREGGLSAHPGCSCRRRPQSGDSHSRLHRRKVEDPSPILSLRNLAAGESSAESLRFRSGSRRKHVRAFSRLFGRSPRLHWRARTSSWLRWITSAALVTTIITDCSKSTVGKRRRRRHRGVEIRWTTKSWRRLAFTQLPRATLTDSW